MVVVSVATSIKLDEYIRLTKTVEEKKMTIYDFVKQAVIEKMQREGI